MLHKSWELFLKYLCPIPHKSYNLTLKGTAEMYGLYILNAAQKSSPTFQKQAAL